MEKLALGKNVDVTFLDFSKAFDLVDHSLLLRKVKSKGFRGKLLQWLQAFLTNRTQCVRVNQTLSSEAKLHSRVPQGSVLGPLFFLIFISDLDANIEDIATMILKYVDDSMIITESGNVDDMERNQQKLSKVYNWVTTNNMTWNQSKFQILRLGLNEDLKENSEYRSQDGIKVIERKSAVKDLGIMVDENLSRT